MNPLISIYNTTTITLTMPPTNITIVIIMKKIIITISNYQHHDEKVELKKQIC